MGDSRGMNDWDTLLGQSVGQIQHVWREKDDRRFGTPGIDFFRRFLGVLGDNELTNDDSAFHSAISQSTQQPPDMGFV